ncbi:alpha-L-rhamnosidase [Echinicola sediminis]
MINSKQSVKVNYAGPPLSSNTQYYWRVRIHTNKGPSPWSDIGSWQMGLLSKDDWKASWISPGYKEGRSYKPSPLLRREFDLNKKIKSATAYITAHGMYQAFINGQKVGDAYFTPGWTSYGKRLQYQAYDVTGLLQAGTNAVGVILGNGWYRGELAWRSQKNIFGADIALLMQIEIEYSDGERFTFFSDGNWKSSTGEILQSSIYNGETIDARKKHPGWMLPDFDQQSWHSVKVNDYGYEKLTATYSEPVRKQETFKPLQVITTPKGETVLDFGQNLVGFVEVDISGKKGKKITLMHAEVLDKKGNFYTDNLRSAKQKNTYILSGKGQEHFEPHFSWQGFRYVKVKGVEGKIDPDNFTAVALYSDMPKTGNFSTSHPLLNQLQHNIQWGQRGNFLDIPTDCPQRDERLGWTGDAQVFFRTAAFNMQVDNFFGKWLRDLAADQLENGAVPHIIPNIMGSKSSGSAGWADAATIIPWNMYLLYGSKEVLRQQYPSMKAWVDYMLANSREMLWNNGRHFGDWLFYKPENEVEGRSTLTDKHLIAQCFFAHSTQILINAARVLGNDEDVENYQELLSHIKSAFLKEYVKENGELISDSQTAYVLALQFDLLPETLRQKAAQALAENIINYDYHLTTGFLGTPYICHVLSRFGYQDLAFTLLMQSSYPSWLYPVTKGATTIWERWDGLKTNGDFQTPRMNSFNHYAYGAIGDWMYRNLAGINSDEALDSTGYKKIIIQPHWDNHILDDKVREKAGPALEDVLTTLETYYGTISSHWNKKPEGVLLSVNIPVNTRATIILPNTGLSNIYCNETPLKDNNDILSHSEKMGNCLITVGSGQYLFFTKNTP